MGRDAFAVLLNTFKNHRQLFPNLLTTVVVRVVELILAGIETVVVVAGSLVGARRFLSLVVRSILYTGLVLLATRNVVRGINRPQ